MSPSVLKEIARAIERATQSFEFDSDEYFWLDGAVAVLKDKYKEERKK